MRSKGVYPVSLGCPKAQDDLEVLLADLLSRGYLPVDDPDRADLILVNTCAFLADARSEADEVIAWAAGYRRAAGGGVRVLVTGCYPKYLRVVGGTIEGVDALLLPEEMRDPALIPVPEPPPNPPPIDRLRITPDHRAFLKIAEGCSNRCAYCLIPALRGPFLPRALDGITAEAGRLLAEGVKELTLTAQDPTAHPQLAALLEGIDRLEGDFWVRLLYLHPAGIEGPILDLFGSLSHLVPYFDVPLQHFSPRVLASMGRKGSALDLPGRMRDLARRHPDGGLRGTFIVGFPGETRQDIDLLLTGIRSIPFDQAVVFPFSPQEGTVAASLPGRLSPEEIGERVLEVQEAIEEVCAAKAASRVGQVTMLLIEEEEEGGAVGRAPFQAAEIDGVVLVEDAGALPAGSWCDVRITGGSDPATLTATRIDRP